MVVSLRKPLNGRLPFKWSKGKKVPLNGRIFGVVIDHLKGSALYITYVPHKILLKKNIALKSQ